MTQILRMLNKWLGIKLAASVTLSLLLLMPTIAQAGDTNNDDVPPDTYGRSGGSRGCDIKKTTSSNNIPALILLVPNQRFGRTVATSPTFAWFIRDSGSWQMEFRLYEYDPVSKKSKLLKEIKDEKFKSSPGIMVLSFSKPVLSINQRYIWQIELICDPNHPAGNPFAEAAIKVVQMPTKLATELSKTQDKFNKANLYAQADLWYDTLGLVLTDEEYPRMRELKFSVLDKVVATEETALREVESAKLRESKIHQMQR
ncbi:MAG: DUF928 domain-containing protein [Stigonema ocellatum SAG 48.90 = DSM 106950]|nr:DUF928 domain-containing protein [Stigonema ocellatum SAG 48.90 = DSM 106950]